LLQDLVDSSNNESSNDGTNLGVSGNLTDSPTASGSPGQQPGVEDTPSPPDCALDPTGCTANGSQNSLVIEGGISLERCVESQVLGMYSGAFILDGLYTPESSVDDCCFLCANTPTCVAWDYCLDDPGCLIPDPLLKGDAPSTMNATELFVNGSAVPSGACVLLSREVKKELVEDKPFSGEGRQFGFYSSVLQEKFLPYINGYKTTQDKNIPDQYDFRCGYSPRKSRCEIVGTIPEVAAICSADTRCRGFVFSESETDSVGILKGGEVDAPLFTGEDFVDDPSSIAYALTASGLESQRGDQTAVESSSSNLWIILVSILGGVALLSIVAVTTTMIWLSQRYVKLKEEAEWSGWCSDNDNQRSESEQRTFNSP
jgi:hypothetical protein